MHLLQPRHIKLKPEEATLLFEKLNVTAAQLPKIKKTDPALPEGAKVGDVIRIERKVGNKVVNYYRVVVP